MFEFFFSNFQFASVFFFWIYDFDFFTGSFEIYDLQDLVTFQSSTFSKKEGGQFHIDSDRPTGSRISGSSEDGSSEDLHGERRAVVVGSDAI